MINILLSTVLMISVFIRSSIFYTMIHQLISLHQQLLTRNITVGLMEWKCQLLTQRVGAKEKFSIALLIKLSNLSWSNGFSMNSKAPCCNDLTAISIFACPEIIITGVSLFLDLICESSSIPSLSPLSNLTSRIATSGNFLSISASAWL